MLERAVDSKNPIRKPHSWCSNVFTRIKMKLGRSIKHAV